MQVRATRKNSFEELQQPGAFLYFTQPGHEGHTGLHFLCPDGCGEMGSVSFVPQPPFLKDPWTWDGNEEKPTVRPSILRLDGCHWHGFLTRGIFSESPDPQETT